MAVEGTKIKELIYRVSVQAKDLKTGRAEIEEELKKLENNSNKTANAGENVSKKFSTALTVLAKDSKAPLNTLTKGIDDLAKAAINLGRAGSSGVGTFGGVFNGVLRSFGIGGVLAGTALGIGTAGLQLGSPLAQQGRGYNARPSELQAFKTTYGSYVQNTQGLFDIINAAKTGDPNAKGKLYALTNSLGIQGTGQMAVPELSSAIISRVPAFAKQYGENAYAVLNSIAPGLIDPYTFNQSKNAPSNSHTRYLQLSKELSASGVDKASYELLDAQNRIGESMTKFTNIMILLADKLIPAMDFITDGLTKVYDLINGKGATNFEIMKNHERKSIDRQLNLFSKTSASTSMMSYEDIRNAQKQIESSGNPNAISSVGARGLYQILPETALEIIGKPNTQGNLAWIKKELFNPNTNSEIRDKYYNQLLARYGSNPLALLAYNQGMGNLDRGTLGAGGAKYLQKFYDMVPGLAEEDPLLHHKVQDYFKRGGKGKWSALRTSPQIAYSPNTNLMQMPDTTLASNSSTSSVMNISTLNIQTDAKNAQELSLDIRKKVDADITASSFNAQWRTA